MIKDMKQKILFKYQEYIDVWTDMIFEQLEDIDNMLKVHGYEDTSDESFRAIVLLTFLSVNSLKVGSKISESIREKIENDLKDNVVNTVFQNSTNEMQSFKIAFNQKYDEYSTLFAVVSNEMDAELVLLSFARLLLNLIKVDKKNNELLININEELSKSLMNFNKLAKNSAASLKIVGKPNFVIERD